MNLDRPSRCAVWMAGLFAVVVCSLVVSACDDGASSSETPKSSTLTTRPAPASASASASGSVTAAQAIVEASNAVSFDSSVDGRGDLLTVWLNPRAQGDG